MVQCPLLKRVSLVALETLAAAELIVSQHVDDRAQVHGKSAVMFSYFVSCNA